MLADWVNALPDAEPVVIAGDFNDWRQTANRPLKAKAGLDEIFTRAHGRPARTFPVQFPLLRLDRIYVKTRMPVPQRRWRCVTGDICPIMPSECGDSFYEIWLA